jgi:hypothetical protein
VLGAYPSALHVAWLPPAGSGLRRVRALPVADEPGPFWDGFDADERIDLWRQERQLDPAVHGDFSSPGGLNGSSGRWVDDYVLTPLRVGRANAWITDCLDTYRLSTSVNARLTNTYDSGRARYGWPEWRIRPHPSETDIVSEAGLSHGDRLLRELDACRPNLLVTLGNAACRVVHALSSADQKRLSLTDYGDRRTVKVGGHAHEWLALAHPAAPRRYQVAHREWLEQQ